MDPTNHWAVKYQQVIKNIKFFKKLEIFLHAIYKFNSEQKFQDMIQKSIITTDIIPCSNRLETIKFDKIKLELIF